MSDYSEAKVNPLNHDRCSTQFSRGWCPHLEKVRGTYHCLVSSKEVDEGDEEDGSDYIFLRTSECKEANA